MVVGVFSAFIMVGRFCKSPGIEGDLHFRP
jgi:hypothetical protein